MDEWTNKRMNELKSKWMDTQQVHLVHQLLADCSRYLNKWMDGWMNEWMNELADKWMNGGRIEGKN